MLVSVAAVAAVLGALGTGDLDPGSFTARFTGTTDGASAAGVIAVTTFLWAGIIACIVGLKVFDRRAAVGKSLESDEWVKG